MEDEVSDNQNTNSKPWLWKKGQSGNPRGRPKGVTMKEYARMWLESMTDEERDEFMNGLPKEVIWKMAEGNPKQDTDITSAGKPIIALSPEIVEKNDLNTTGTGS